MNMRLAAKTIAAALAAGCSPVADAPPTSDPADRSSPAAATGFPFEPTAEMRAAFPNCTWEEVRAAGLAMHSFACPNARLVGDETLPGFQLVTIEPNGAETRTPVVRVFSKPPEASIDAALEPVRAASPGWATATCVFAPGTPNLGERAVGRYLLMPTGRALDVLEACLNLEREVGCTPCGSLGVPGTDAVTHTFETLDGAPEKVVFVDWGFRSPQIYYPESLRVVE
jgi:hypothetical protein